MSVAEGFESMWSLHGRFPPEQASTQSTMRFFCDLKNMIVAIIKSTKVHLGLAWLLELWGESVHIFSFLFLLEWKENDLLMFLQAKCLFPAQVFGWTSLLVRDLWSSPPVVALACLHILPYLCILQDQRLLLFWIVPEAEHCFFLCFSTEQECLASSNWSCSSSCLGGLFLGFIMIINASLLGWWCLRILLLSSSPVQSSSTPPLYSQWMQP